MKRALHFFWILIVTLSAGWAAHGISPPMWAGNDLEETISLLLKKGADVNARDKNGYTALHHWTRWWQDD